MVLYHDAIHTDTYFRALHADARDAAPLDVHARTATMLTTTTLPTLAHLTARCGVMARGGAAAHRWMTPTMTSAQQRRTRSGVVVRADGKPAELAPLEQRVDLRVGKVLSAKKHEEADKLVRVG